MVAAKASEGIAQLAIESWRRDMTLLEATYSVASHVRNSRWPLKLRENSVNWTRIELFLNDLAGNASEGTLDLVEVALGADVETWLEGEFGRRQARPSNKSCRYGSLAE